MKNLALPRSFYERDTETVAKELLGKVLVHETEDGVCSGTIVEVEAYLHPYDEAAHTFRGQTPRNAAMFGLAGHAYVYFTYGMHYCMNVVTKKPGEGVLIRALEPSAGIELMKKRRQQDKVENLCNGPGKLTQALDITKEHNANDVTRPPLYVAEGRSVSEEEMGLSPRIGITKSMELELRFFVKNSPFLSRR